MRAFIIFVLFGLLTANTYATQFYMVDQLDTNQKSCLGGIFPGGFAASISSALLKRSGVPKNVCGSFLNIQNAITKQSILVQVWGVNDKQTADITLSKNAWGYFKQGSPSQIASIVRWE